MHGTNYMMKEQTFIENAGVDNLLFAAMVLGVVITPTPTRGNSKRDDNEVFLPDSYLRNIMSLSSVSESGIRRLRMRYLVLICFSPLGHVRYFFGDPAKHYQTFASAVAHGPQNLSVTIVNKGWWKLWLLQKSEPTALRMKAQVHDSARFNILRIDLTFGTRQLNALEHQ